MVGEATPESGICEPASAEGAAGVEVVGDDAACLLLGETDGQWLIDGFEEATPVCRSRTSVEGSGSRRKRP